MAHQVGVTDEPEDAPKKAAERKVSFDQSKTDRAPLDRKDSYSGVTRVSFDKPADLYVTSVQSQPEAVQEAPEPAAEAASKPEAGAGNTDTAKRRKSKKKRDEVRFLGLSEKNPDSENSRFSNIPDFFLAFFSFSNLYFAC